MAENFKTSEAERFFGGSFIKVAYSGGSYKEINDNLSTALSHNKDIGVIIRVLDMTRFIDDKDAMREDLGDFPEYLYDDNPFNDVQYILNRDVIFKRVYPMEVQVKEPDFQPGITDFDSYSNWMQYFTFGCKSVYEDTDTIDKCREYSDRARGWDESVILDNIRQNITSLADRYPNVAFYCVFTPYSAGFWEVLREEGTIPEQIEIEKVVTEELLRHDNIRVFSFNTCAFFTTDLNNYKDIMHYGEWINSLMLRYIQDGKCELTLDNYNEYLESEMNLYDSFDYSALKSQVDYEDDYMAAEMLHG